MLTKTTFSHNIIRAKYEEAFWQPQWLVMGNFEDDSFPMFCNQFNTLLDRPQDIIPIIIDSYGGHVHSLLGMLDMIKASPKPVATIVESKAFSCGALLLSAGHRGYRFASPSASILVHEVSSGIEGSATDMKNDMKETEALNDTLMAILASNSHKPKRFYADLIRDAGNVDLYISPKEAKRYGLIDKIYVPSFEMDVQVKYSIKESVRISGVQIPHLRAAVKKKIKLKP